MADIAAFFNDYLPKKLSENPDLATEINAVYQFDIDGAGNWIVDLTKNTVSEGQAADAGCTVTVNAKNFSKLLDKPSAGMMMFTMGKLKVSNIALGMSLQKLLG